MRRYDAREDPIVNGRSAARPLLDTRPLNMSRIKIIPSSRPVGLLRPVLSLFKQIGRVLPCSPQKDNADLEEYNRRTLMSMTHPGTT